MTTRLARHLGTWTLASLCLAALPAAGEEPASHGKAGPPVTPFVFTGDVRDLPPPKPWRPGDPVCEIPQRFAAPPQYAVDPTAPVPLDALTARQLEWVDAGREVDASFVSPTRNFPGAPFTGTAPPDTVGDVGPAHFVQAVNGPDGPEIRIWDKAAPTPNLLAAFELESLPGSCNGIGDPIVIYDRQADRWLLAQYGNLCVAISISGDPVAGGWYFYDLAQSGRLDYPKYSVWPTDADGGSGSYVVTVNDDFAGLAVALERGAMLAGQPARTQTFVIDALPGFGIHAPTPAQTDSALAPPSGSPAIVMQHRDTESHGGPAAPADLLELWLLDVSWTATSTSTLTLQNLDVAEFDSSICGLVTFDCVPQPGTSVRLAPLREPIMHRLVYMNHGTHESLVGNFTVDADGNDHAGVRWFELRRQGGASWELGQEGTVALDADHRFMGAIAMDREGNIALGYNVSSSETFPGLRYVGRQWFDPPGVMSQPETVVIDGAATNPINRYGDYASMGLDPSDGCTFWFTGEHNPATNWGTQVASFRFASCLCESTPELPAPAAIAAGANRVELSWNDVSTATVEEYLVQRSRTPGGPYATIATLPDSSPGSGGGAGYLFNDDDVSGGTTYHYVVVARDGDCRSTPLNEVQATATGACTLPPIFAGLEQATSAQFASCRVDLEWSAAQAECAGPVAYNVFRSTTPGFTPGPATLLVQGVSGTALSDVNGLQHGVDYSYIVRAVDLATGAEDPNLTERSVAVAGLGTGTFRPLEVYFATPAEFDEWTVTIGPGAHRCGEWELVWVNEERPPGTFGFFVQARPLNCGPLPLTSSALTSTLLDVSAPGLQNATLEASLYYAYGDGGDVATVEVWDGVAWQVVWTAPAADWTGRLSLDVTAQAAGTSDFQVRFNYQNALNDRWFSVDDVLLRTVYEVVCTTDVGPPPVPDGSGTTAPLVVDRIDSAGTQLQLTWDGASCPGVINNLLWGDLAAVSAWSLSGAMCDVGSGSYDWNGAPTGDLFVLLVAGDGATTEGSWGMSSVGERNALTPSGFCSVDTKNITADCTPP